MCLTFPFTSKVSPLLLLAAEGEEVRTPWSQSEKGLENERSSISDSDAVTSFNLFDILSPISTAARQGQKCRPR